MLSWLITIFQIPGKMFLYLSQSLRSAALLSLPDVKTTLIKAAERAGGILKEYYGSNFQVSNKEGYGNLVTEADHAARKSNRLK